MVAAKAAATAKTRRRRRGRGAADLVCTDLGASFSGTLRNFWGSWCSRWDFHLRTSCRYHHMERPRSYSCRSTCRRLWSFLGSIYYLRFQ